MLPALPVPVIIPVITVLAVIAVPDGDCASTLVTAGVGARYSRKERHKKR